MLNFHSVLLFPNKNGSFFTSEPTPVPPPCSNQDPPLKTLIDFTPLDSSPETSDRYREREKGGGGGDFLRSESLSGSTLGGAYSQQLDLELELLKLCSLHPSFCIEKNPAYQSKPLQDKKRRNGTFAHSWWRGMFPSCHRSNCLSYMSFDRDVDWCFLPCTFHPLVISSSTEPLLSPLLSWFAVKSCTCKYILRVNRSFSLLRFGKQQ